MNKDLKKKLNEIKCCVPFEQYVALKYFVLEEEIKFRQTYLI